MLATRSLFAVLLFAACAGSSAKQADAPWRLELTSSGGISGRGLGAFAIDSKGAVVVKTISGQTCELRESEEALRKLAAEVQAATPEIWAASYVPENNCCDRIQWTLTFERGGAKRETIWIDDPKPMPSDLAAIVKTLATLRAKHVCR
jgi:hypothetical protein